MLVLPCFKQASVEGKGEVSLVVSFQSPGLDAWKKAPQVDERIDASLGGSTLGWGGDQRPARDSAAWQLGLASWAFPSRCWPLLEV